MKGRDLIIYILEHHLEDTDVLGNLRTLGLYSVEEVAVKFNVGTATVKAWCNLGRFDYTKIDDRIYIWMRDETGGKNND